MQWELLSLCQVARISLKRAAKDIECVHVDNEEKNNQGERYQKIKNNNNNNKRKNIVVVVV